MRRIVRGIMGAAIIGGLSATGFMLLAAANVSAEARRGAVATSFKDCAVCPELIEVLAGSFTMGSPDSEPGRYPNEGPQRSITFAHPFAVGRYSVTFSEWDACVADGGCGGYRPDDSSWGREKQPVINVSWEDATLYTQWLSSKTGKRYRLPSEAEREYFARAGTKDCFWWGCTVVPAQANYNHRQNDRYGGVLGEPPRKTLPVDSHAPNPWGLHNVHGNIWEWTDDCWPLTLAEKPADGSVSKSDECEWRAVRGGSFSDFVRITRSSARLGFGKASRASNIGFRIVRDAVNQ
jgi:formylglycine-generating enzyme required for sulfatase activity